MLRGYRLLVIALGLVLLGAGEAPKNSRNPQQGQAQSETSQASSSVPENAAEPAQAVEPPEYYQPCKQAGDKASSDLCAQWSAANAAREAADWAWLQMWLSGLGVLGLGITLWFNFRALDLAETEATETKDALGIARQNADAASLLANTSKMSTEQQLRAYVYLDRYYVRKRTEADVLLGYDIFAVWKN